MCTVVVRWHLGQPVLVLALRDELVGREFDDPDAWWPGAPTVVGGRDRVAGGSWCVSDVATGASALVLNRRDRPYADPGAPSRGVLPLLAVEHGPGWPEQLDLAGMASFALVLAAPDRLLLWVFDGEDLTQTALPEGTHMVTSGGDEDGKAERYLSSFDGVDDAAQWRELVAGQEPVDDPAALVVRHDAGDGRTYATVFGQVLTGSPGRLSLSWSRTPWVGASWTDLVR